MKRLLSSVLIVAFLLASPASAVLKKITVKPLKLVTTIDDGDGVAGLLVAGNSIVLYGTSGDNSFARALDINGQELWNIALEPEAPSIATAGVVDGAGNIWIAGTTTLARSTPAPAPSPLIPLNPDNVINPPEPFNSDLNALALWKISAGSSESFLFTSLQSAPVLVTGMAADKNGISLVGITQGSKGSSGYVVTVSPLGEFEKPVLIGKTSTTLDAVVRHVDGSKTVTGASAETIGGKKLAGITDGIIVKISKTNTILSVIRSSATKARRNWNSATSNLLLGGEVVIGNKIESAVTKFTQSYAPTWTYRFASSGLTLTAASNYAFFASTSKISQLNNWAPKKPQPLLLKFDAKGLISEAFGAPNDQDVVLGITRSKELGILVLTSNTQGLSIFSAT